jgi:mandelate racemase
MTISNLKFRNLKCTPVAVPMARPLGTSAQTITTAPFILIDLETEEGITGRTYLFGYSPLGTRLILTVLEDMATFLKGDPVAPREVAKKFAQRYRLMAVSGIPAIALAGLDCACWDALAIAAGKPLTDFLGGVRKPVPAYNSNGLGLMSPDAAAQEGEELLEGGFRAVKLRLGYPTLAGDLEVAQVVRKRLPANVEIMTDYNQALNREEGLNRCRALDSMNFYWIEEPIQHDDYAGNAQIAREIDTPLQIGENFQGPNAMSAAIALKASDYMMPDLTRIGGVSGWQQAASIAADAGMKISTHLFPEVCVHLLACSPTAHWLEYVDWAAPILAEPLRITDGTATPPNRPGTGIEWNEEAVARYRMTNL